MIAQEEVQQGKKHICFCELCMPTINSEPVAQESDDEETAPEPRPEAVVALAA